MSSAYDRVAGVYDSLYRDRKSQAEDALIRRLLHKYVKQDGSVLDLGCGTGLTLDLLGPGLNPVRYIGVDISTPMLRQAREKHPDGIFKLGDMTKLQVEPESQDLVTCFYALNYVHPVLDAMRAVWMMYRSLKPGGTVLATIYGQRRKNDVLNVPAERTFYTSRAVRGLFDIFGDVSVMGMSGITPSFPRWMPQWAFNGMARAETATVGKLSPDAFYFMIVIGRKQAHGSDPPASEHHDV